MPGFLYCRMSFDIRDNKEKLTCLDKAFQGLEIVGQTTYLIRLTDYTSASDLKGIMHHGMTGFLFFSATVHVSFAPLLFLTKNSEIVL